MDSFWAKSDGETIVQHTTELLQNYELLKSLYPTIPVNWSLLKQACQNHDLGKMNSKFQQKVQQNKRQITGEIPHALLSVALVPIEKLRKVYSESEIRALYYSIALHHERDFSAVEADPENYKLEIENLKEPAGKFEFEKLGLEPIDAGKIKKVTKRYFSIGTRINSEKEFFQTYVMLKGLLNRIDYAASGHYPVEYPANFLTKNLNRIVEKWRQNDPDANWNDMQQFAYQNQAENLVIIGQTGLGKTEAGLRWIGDQKGFFTLPLKAAINAIYDRIGATVTDDITKEVGLLHSDSLAVLMKEDTKEVEEYDRIAHYLTETKSWSLPLTVTTLDQTFDFVYHYPGFELKLATFAYSKIVIDEIQMYSPDLLAYLIKGLKEIQDFGGKFLIMTATLPTYLLDLFSENGLEFKMNTQPFLDAKLAVRHNVEVVHRSLSAQDIISHYENNQVLVICNTVKAAQTIFSELEVELPDVEINLLHSRFIRNDRQQKEKAIMDFANEKTRKGIWVATQVVEASLDIDFDLLITELSELNGLFQRMGRCYRKRALASEQPNVYVFDGGEGPTSGISRTNNAVVHRDIFELSKKALQTVSGNLSEKEKMTLIANTYTTQNMAKTEYYHGITHMIRYLKDTENDGVSKKEVRKLFRNIQTQQVIPQSIWEEHQLEITQAIETLQKSYRDLTKQEKIELKRQKQQQRIKLENLMVTIPQYQVLTAQKNGQLTTYQINDYERLFILDCDYDVKIGAVPRKAKPILEDNFF